MAEPTMTKRILMIVLNPLGGIQTYLLNNGALLKNSGYEFTFVAPKNQAFEAFKQHTCDWPSVEFVDAPVRNGRYKLRQTIRRTLKSSEFSLIHSQGLRAGTEVEISNYVSRIPHIITLHDTRHASDFSGTLGILKRNLVEYFSGRADVIIPVSQDCATNHLSFFPSWMKSRCSIQVIQNGVDISSLLARSKHRCAMPLRTECDWGDHIKIMGYFGRFMPEKGFLVLLDALRLLATRGLTDQLRLVATRDPHGYRGEYIREVQRDDALSKMVRFVDPVRDISPLLSQMDVLAMPSLREACPLLPMEAMVLGVPIIGSDAIGLREVLRDTPALTPPAGDSVALAAAIEHVIKSPCKKQAEAYASLAQMRFDNQPAAKKLLELYSTVAR
jgi:glycosyltransferase involved in cell wall biosynthesis